MSKKEISKCNGFITMRQLSIVFILSLMNQIIRIVSSYCTEISKQTAWIAVLITFPLFYIFICIINNFIKKHPNKSLRRNFLHNIR